MPTLTYWIAPCLSDSDCYSIREKTKKACVARLIANGLSLTTINEGFREDDFVPRYVSRGPYGSKYGIPHKVTVEYLDSFDLVQMALGEGRIWEGEG
jgi:hypothetical protein